MDYQSFTPNPLESQTPQQIPPTHKTFTSKFIGVVVGILVFGGVTYSGFWFWNDKYKEASVPTFTPRVTDEMAGWATYRNEKYGFEFKYPSSLTLIDEGSRLLIESHYNFLGHINISLGKVTEEIQKIKNEISDTQGAKLISEKLMSIDSYDFSQIIADYPESGVDQNIYNFVQVGGLVYEISFFIFETDFPFDQILSTFKFVEQSVVTGKAMCVEGVENCYDTIVCIQAITPARNPQTGEVKDFSTSCDVPEGWEKI